MEVLGWAAKGKTASETAQIMGLGVATVRHHWDMAVGKLDAVNMVQAVGKAVAKGLIHIC